MQFNIFSRSLEFAPELSKITAENIAYHSDSQTQIDVVDNVYYIPQWRCLYDSEGDRIASSVLHRDRRRVDDFWPACPVKIVAPNEASSFNEPIVFLSVLFPHYGHFITECIARMWAMGEINDPSAKLLYAEADRGCFRSENYVTELLALGHISLSQFVFFDHPTKLRRVYIPHPSFYLQREAYSNHVMLPRSAAEYALGGTLPPLSDQPVYFSRSRFKGNNGMANNRRVAVNEAELEYILEENGFLICYPETLNFEEKIKLLNSHRFFVGPRASIFLSTTFSLRAIEQEACVLYETGDEQAIRAYVLTDLLSGMRTNYLECVRPFVGNILDHDRSGIGPDFQIDIQQTLAWLSRRGVLKPRQPAGDTAGSAASRRSGEVVGGLKVFVSGRDNRQGVIFNQDGLAAGRRFGGMHICAMCVDLPELPNDQIEYQCLMGQGVVSDWVKGGTWCGKRGQRDPIFGFAVRLLGNAGCRLEARYVGTFVGDEEPVWAANGQLCCAGVDTPLEALQIFIEYKSVGPSDLGKQERLAS